MHACTGNVVGRLAGAAKVQAEPILGDSSSTLYLQFIGSAYTERLLYFGRPNCIACVCSLDAIWMHSSPNCFCELRDGFFDEGKTAWNAQAHSVRVHKWCSREYSRSKLAQSPVIK